MSQCLDPHSLLMAKPFHANTSPIYSRYWHRDSESTMLPMVEAKNCDSIRCTHTEIGFLDIIKHQNKQGKTPKPKQGKNQFPLAFFYLQPPFYPLTLYVIIFIKTCFDPPPPPSPFPLFINESLWSSRINCCNISFWLPFGFTPIVVPTFRILWSSLMFVFNQKSLL